jgi:oxygen-independent coproporphyrinogen-3 oxidase
VAFGLYLHIPFCASKCPYCDFYSGVFAESLVAGYLDAMVAEIERAANDPEVAPLPATGPATSLFVGGGTPSHLATQELARLFAALRASFPLAEGAEISVECNPESLTPEMAAGLLDHGVNRVSVGVQSLDNRVLERLGRPHDAAQAEAAARLARQRFPRVSYDLILGVPGLTETGLRATLDRLLAFEPDHLSAYGLTIEPGTDFAGMRARGDFHEVGDEGRLAQDAITEEYAARAGLRRYEVSNYARPGRECEHNLAIWRGGFYLGFGPSAASHLPTGPHGTRRTNIADLSAYVGRLARGDSPVARSERLTREQAITERLLLELRLAEGLDKRAFGRRFGTTLAEVTGGALAPLAERGLLVDSDSHLTATGRGRRLLDGVITRLTSNLVTA